MAQAAAEATEHERPADPTAQPGAASGQRYLAFISYRRRDGGTVANWLRQRIGTFVPPRELKTKVALADQRVGGRFNRVFLDLSYQRSHADFWRDHIAPSVTRSENLLLLLTPSVFQKLPDGEPNWVEREIETFLQAGNDPGRILLVLGPGASDDRLPDPLARLSARWDWADLRFFKDSPFARWRRSVDYDAQLTKILARIFDVDDGELPALTREFERARARTHRRIYTAGAVTIVGLAGLTAWASIERTRAIRAEATAVEQRDEAVRQRNAALVAQSLFLTQSAAVFRRQGSVRQAMKLLVPALPDKAHGNDRPLVGETVAETYRALYGDRELQRIALPEGTAATASSASGKRIAAITPTQIVFLDLPSGRTARTVENPDGVVERAVLSADGSKILMVAADGRTRVVDSESGAVLARHPGLRVKTGAQFASGSSKVVLQSADSRQLVLIDVASGQSTTRQFKSAISVYVSEDGETLLIAADGQIRSLSPADLSDVATRPLTDEAYVAFAKAPDGSAIIMASGSSMLKGAVSFLDPQTLAETRQFRLTLGAVTDVSISPDNKTIAVHTPPNLTFYEADTGFPQSVEATSATTGSFVATGYERYRNYAYASNGIITITVPGLNLQTNYKSADEADLVNLVMDDDGQAFTSITATPVVTRWSAKDVAVRQPLALDRKIGQTSLRNFPFMASAGSADRKRLAVSYADGAIGVWDIPQARVLTTVNAPMRKGAAPNATTFSPDSRFVARGESSGDLSLLDIERGKVIQGHLSDQPIAQVQFADDRRMLVELQDGSILSALEEDGGIRTAPLAAFGYCQRLLVVKAVARCNMPDGGARVVDIADGTEIWRTAAETASGASAIAVLPQGDRLVAVDRHALFSLRSIKGEPIWELQLTSVLSGSMLLDVADSSLIDASTREAILKGAKEVQVKLPSNGVLVSPDGRLALVFFPDRTLQLVDLERRTARVVFRFEQPVRYATFSANGRQIAAFATPGDNAGHGTLQIYDIGLDRIIYESYGVFPFAGRIFPMADGQGFVVAMPPYNLTIFPIYERSEDLVDAVTKRYPEQLSPQQRHYFHID